MEEKKRIISKFEVVLVVLAVVLMGYLFMKSKGKSIATISETVEITDNPKSKKEYVKKGKSAEEKRRSKDVEDMLKQLDGREEGRNYKPNHLVSANNIAKENSPDEDRFFKLVSQKYKENGLENDSPDFFKLLKNSRNTYRTVRNFFADPNETPKSELETLAEDVSFLLQNKTVASSIYAQLEEQFNIPQDKSKAFAEQGKKAVSDWATFVEENKE